jgi:small subunit ribosomal protein S8
MTTDPIADLLTRIRNAQMRRKTSLTVPMSRLKASVLAIMQREGFIKAYRAETPEGGHPQLVVDLKYVEGRAAIEGIRRISRPGLRRYVSHDEIPRVQGGLGVAILSTSRGILTDREARKGKIGGEVLCALW